MSNDREGVPALFRNAYSLLSDEARAKLRGETPTLDHGDRVRLGRQLQGVRALMSDGQWRTLAEVSAALGMGFPENGATIERRRRGPGRGLWEYRYAVE